MSSGDDINKLSSILLCFVCRMNISIVSRNSTVALNSDNNIINRWRWDWLDKEDDNGDKLRSYMRKIEEDGFAFCICCNIKVNYSEKGWHMMIKRHANADSYKNAKKYVLISSSTLPMT